NSPEVGGAVKNVEAQIDGDELEISFNVDYIVDVLRIIDAKQVNIALNDKYSPAKFTEPENENYIYIATPVRA
ncbi:MAG: DNA polymerase III subunit beta, partial [Selenomonadaceae bacterium]|nr:DNA polymerase III subunit beta [Selenomonadaceae bacterium]